MNPPRSPGVDVRARAICDRLDVVALALADIAGRLGRLNANVEAVMVAVAGGTLAERQAAPPTVPETLAYARQVRGIAAALGPGPATVADQIDFGFGKPDRRTTPAPRGAPGGRT